MKKSSLHMNQWIKSLQRSTKRTAPIHKRKKLMHFENMHAPIKQENSSEIKYDIDFKADFNNCLTYMIMELLTTNK